MNKGNNLENEYNQSKGADSTKDLVDSITLLGGAGEIYENLKFEVIVTAERLSDLKLILHNK